MSTNPMLEAALHYAAKGWAVTPVHNRVGDTCSCKRSECPSIGKHPRLTGWQEKGVPDEETIRGWFTTWPQTNIGIVTGTVSGVFALDIDPDKDGEESLAKLVEEHGALPETLVARTGKLGAHFLFSCQDIEIKNSVCSLGPGLDIRGERGCIVAAPSKHENGNKYEWLSNPMTTNIAAAPEWLIKLMREPASQQKREVLAIRQFGGQPGPRLVNKMLETSARNLAGLEEGSRNDYLNKASFVLARFIVRGDLARSVVEAGLTEAGLACGLPEDEIAATLKSALDAGIKKSLLEDYPLSEGGSAKRLVDRFALDLKYVPTWGWLNWNGKCWEGDEGKVYELCKAMIKDLYSFAKEAIASAQALMDSGDEEAGKEATKEANALLTHAKRSDSAGGISGMLKMASTAPEVWARTDRFDKDPWLLNVLNGTLDLRTGTLHPHDRSDLITKMAPVQFDPDAICPTWDKFLARIMAEDQDLISFIKRGVGYSLTGLTKEQVLFICHGAGRNGKSVFAETIGKMLGAYAAETPAETLMVKRSGDSGISNDLARLAGVRLVGANESEEGQRLAEAKIKAMTGGDRITARFLRQEFFEFQPQFKLWLRTNHRPDIWGSDEGIWRRIRLIPFAVTIPEDEIDYDLPLKLEAELAGILRWAVEGCLEWQQKGLGIPECVREATQSYRVDMDSIGQFLQQIDLKSYPAGDLYFTYQAWCTANAETARSQKAFGRRLTELGWQTKRDKKGNIRIPPSQQAG